MRRVFAARGTAAAATGMLVLLIAGGGYAIASGGSDPLSGLGTYGPCPDDQQQIPTTGGWY
jgi:hypothetical protein